MSTGFKEWALVCEALGKGEQSIILRKGGIAEGRDGFRFKHDEFLLFPTLFHEQLAKTKFKLPPGMPAGTNLAEEVVMHRAEEGVVRIQYSARAEWTELVTDLALVKKLAPFHIWKDSEIEQRFHYDEPQGVSLAFIRVFRLEPAFSFPDEAKYGGCRSWVTLPELPAGTKLVPVLDDAAHAERAAAVRGVLGKRE